MARVGRLSGGLLVETHVAGDPAWFLVGDTKVPCDWSAAGFEAPPERNVVDERFVRLKVQGRPGLAGTTLSIALEGAEAARVIGERLTVSRNGSVSERLWSLIVGESEIHETKGRSLPCTWLCEMPAPIWEIVRETVLKCS